MSLVASTGPFVQPKRLSAWLKHEYALDLCRTPGVLASDAAADRKVVSGEVLGALTAGGAFTPLDPSASTGAQIAAGIAIHDTTAPKGQDVPILVLDGGPSQVLPIELTWPAGITAAQRAKALRDLRAIGIRAAVD